MIRMFELNTEWTGRQLFYALVFTITFFVAFLYILTVIF
jgi:hypothetical protein